MEEIPVRKTLVWYTLLRKPPIRSTQLENCHVRPMYTSLVSAGSSGLLLPLLDNHGLEVLALVHLGLDVGDQVGEVWGVLSFCQCPASATWIVCSYLLGLGPLLLGQERVGHGQLPLVSHLISTPAFLGAKVPGKRGAGGRHGRRPPGVGGA